MVLYIKANIYNGYRVIYGNVVSREKMTLCEILGLKGQRIALGYINVTWF
jgi:hypothetical protein